jgi:GntR family transcriptional regulator
MHINNLSNSPIHEQIELDIKKQIAKGVLKPGDRVLSVRELATTLKINPNTVTRAYKQL